MIVPYERLSAEALAAVIEEYVTRDGTELSEAARKSASVRDALAAGELVIVWDDGAESCNILARDEARARAIDYSDEPTS